MAVGNEITLVNESHQSFILRGTPALNFPGKLTTSSEPRQMTARVRFDEEMKPAGLDILVGEKWLERDFVALRVLSRAVVAGEVRAYQRTAPGSLDSIATMRTIGEPPKHAGGGTSGVVVL